MFVSPYRLLLLALLVTLSGAGLTFPVSAQTPSKIDDARELNIPAGSLVNAIEKLRAQSGIQVMYETSLAEGLTVPALNGTFTVRAALTRLLVNTGLKFDSANDKTVVLKRANAATSNALPADQMRVADASREVPSQKSGAEEPETNEKGTPEILVRGSRTLNADIQRTKDDIQPYVIYTADEIQRSMATNLEDFFRSRLTMSTPPTSVTGELAGSFSQSPMDGSNQSQISLRGLGVDETLILVNGRRRPGVSYIYNASYTLSTKGGFGQPDINGIPLSSIERIEILPATASGIYGGGATGGVINIVLKTDYTGAEVSANYANTFDGESGLKRITANGGMTLEGGKSSISFTASYSEQNPLFVRDRAFFQTDVRTRIASSDPRAYESRNFALPVGYTPNIRAIQTCTYPPPNYTPVCTPSSQPITLRLKPQFGGTILNSIITHIPVGYTGDLQDLVDNAGTVDLGLANDLANAGRSIVNSPRTNSVNLALNRDFNDWLSMYANVSRSMNHGSTRYAGVSNTGYTLGVDAPTNPFDTPIQVSIPFPGYSFGRSNDSESLDGILGATFNLPHGWRAQLEGSWGRSRSQSFGGDPFVFYDQGYSDPVTYEYTRTREGLFNAIARGAIDVLVDTNLHPLDLSDYLMEPYPNRTQTPADSVSTGGVLRLSGPVLRIPGGAVMVSGLLERHENEAKEVVATTRNYGGDGLDYYEFFPSRSTNTDSYYVEATIPVFSASNALPWMRSLDLQISTRRDKSTSQSVRTDGLVIDGPDDRPASVEYTDSSVTGTGYTFGFRFSPVQDVTLRSSFSRGFLPPSLIQLSPIVGSTDITDYTDPRYSYPPADSQRDYESVGAAGLIATLVRGGNPDLKPETSDSLSAGLILTPRFAPDLRVSIDYTEIKKENEIAPIDTLNLLRLSPEEAERIYPGRIVRAAPRPSESYAVGPVTFLDYSLINNLRSTVRAVDFQVSYSLDTTRAGHFEIYGVATQAVESSRQPIIEAPLVDSVGFHDGPLRWRGNLGLDWSRGALSLGWNMQYLDKYKIIYSGDDPLMYSYYIRRQGAAYVPDQTYHDISFRYDLGQSRFSSVRMLEGLRISGGVQNVLDTHPPVDIRNGELGYSVYGDPRLRRYTLEVVKSF